MNTPDVDVAIVGASLAGCAAAKLLAQKGFSVALVEKQADPNYFKPICTHYLLSSATPTLQRLGLIDALEASGAVRGNHNVWTPWGWIPHVQKVGIPAYGYSLPRESLDPMLRQLALNEPNVAYLPGHTLRAIERNPAGRINGLMLQVRNGSERRVTARLCVGADGRTSKFARLAAVPEQKFENNRFLYYRYFRNLPLKTGHDAQVWMLNPDLAYCFPNPYGMTLAAVMIGKDHHDSFRQNMEANLAQFIGRLPDAPDFSKAEPVGPVLGMYDLSLYVRNVGGEGLALVGDAALTTDPIAGAGCGWALQSAEWLADCVEPVLRATPAALDAGLKKYADLHSKNLLSHQRNIAKYSQAPLFTRDDGALFALLAKTYSAQQWFHTIYSRNRQPAMPIGLLMRLLLRTLRSNQPTDTFDYNWGSFECAKSQ